MSKLYFWCRFSLHVVTHAYSSLHMARVMSNKMLMVLEHDMLRYCDSHRVNDLGVDITNIELFL